jgi:hypothetical protein
MGISLEQFNSFKQSAELVPQRFRDAQFMRMYPGDKCTLKNLWKYKRFLAKAALGAC